MGFPITGAGKDVVKAKPTPNIAQDAVVSIIRLASRTSTSPLNTGAFRYWQGLSRTVTEWCACPRDRLRPAQFAASGLGRVTALLGQRRRSAWVSCLDERLLLSGSCRWNTPALAAILFRSAGNPGRPHLTHTDTHAHALYRIGLCVRVSRLTPTTRTNGENHRASLRVNVSHFRCSTGQKGVKI